MSINGITYTIENVSTEIYPTHHDAHSNYSGTYGAQGTQEDILVIKMWLFHATYKPNYMLYDQLRIQIGRCF